ncbi:hypothetical protein [Mycolicibacterium baixiangningiae]|uniref:hypothetical protein n=1 Tax=Mycolicibacterium baixiangningiae TaxID=2761578 RepID=UPI001868995C|nr:hypothetical protein [Mycolicibacterium baixiangningiae]
MEQVPTPTSPVVPSSQREAQDTINRYLVQTVNALPRGTSLDGTRYAIGNGTSFCEDDPTADDPPVKVTDWRDMTFPPGTNYGAVIAQVGELWKSWGWQVLERNGFDKPNRFGYAPDGYILQIGSRPDPSQPPSLIASSPCFPQSREGDVEKSLVIEQSAG